jgi:hypothetical protein
MSLEDTGNNFLQNTVTTYTSQPRRPQSTFHNMKQNCEQDDGSSLCTCIPSRGVKTNSARKNVCNHSTVSPRNATPDYAVMVYHIHYLLCISHTHAVNENHNHNEHNQGLSLKACSFKLKVFFVSPSSSWSERKSVII